MRVLRKQAIARANGSRNRRPCLGDGTIEDEPGEKEVVLTSYAASDDDPGGETATCPVSPKARVPSSQVPRQISRMCPTRLVLSFGIAFFHFDCHF